MKEYKDSNIFKAGMFYRELGELLVDPDTELQEIADFATRHNLNAKFSFIPDKSEEDQGE